MKAIKCGQLIDGNEKESISDCVVLIENGKIQRVGVDEEVEIPSEYDIINYENSTLLPGLIDAHVHLGGWRSMNPFDWIQADVATGTARATEDLRKLLLSGFTTIRDVGSVTGLGLKTAVKEGSILGPRIFSSGRSLSQTAGHGDAHFLPHDWVKSDQARVTLTGSVLADGVDECRRETRKRIREGSDLIKIMSTGGVTSEKDFPRQPQFTEDEISAITQEAHRANLTVASHAQSSVGVKNSVKNGVDTIEHGYYLDNESISLMDENDVIFVPTLSIGYKIATQGQDHGVPEYGIKKAKDALDSHFRSVKDAYSAGVKIALGTDSLGPSLAPHGDSVTEMELMVQEVGMKPIDAIISGTKTAAKCLPINNVGFVSKGNFADLLVVENDPIQDIANMRSIQAVYKNGEEVVSHERSRISYS